MHMLEMAWLFLGWIWSSYVGVVVVGGGGLELGQARRRLPPTTTSTSTTRPTAIILTVVAVIGHRPCVPANTPPHPTQPNLCTTPQIRRAVCW